MKRALVFLFLGPICGSLVTMLFEVQFLLRLGAIFSPTSFGVAFFFGYIAGLVPALILGFVDWLAAGNSNRTIIVSGLAFLMGCLATAIVFDWPWIIAAGVLAAATAAACSWLSGRAA